MIDKDVEPVAKEWLDEILPALRLAVRGREPHAAADAVAAALRGGLPSRDVLSASECAGSPDCYQQHVLYVEPDGSFSIVVLVWRPGQRTTVHDHRCWCVVGVIAGTETETRYQLKAEGDERLLVPMSETQNVAGTVCGFAPPGDIHYVRNASDQTVMSLHVYGANIALVGSSVRRSYAAPTNGAEVIRISADTLR